MRWRQRMVVPWHTCSENQKGERDSRPPHLFSQMGKELFIWWKPVNPCLLLAWSHWITWEMKGRQPRRVVLAIS